MLKLMATCSHLSDHWPLHTASWTCNCKACWQPHRMLEAFPYPSIARERETAGSNLATTTSNEIKQLLQHTALKTRCLMSSHTTTPRSKSHPVMDRVSPVLLQELWLCPNDMGHVWSWRSPPSSGKRCDAGQALGFSAVCTPREELPKVNKIRIWVYTYFSAFRS